MMGFLTMLAGKTIFGRVIGEKASAAIMAIGSLLLVAAVIGGGLALIRRDAVSDHEAQVQQRARPATDQAASERARDAIRNDKSDQERHDVIKAQPDQPISPTSRALACKRLRDAGRNPPACR